jgi:hypothetical protein
MIIPGGPIQLRSMPMEKSTWFVIGILLITIISLGGGSGTGQAHLLSPAMIPEKVNNPPLGPHFPIETGDENFDFWSIVFNSRHNEFLVLWHTYQDMYTTDIWAKRVGLDGSVKDKFLIASSPGERISGPVGVYSPVQDEYLVVYTNFHLDSSSRYDIFARRVAWDGSWKSSEIKINTGNEKHWGPAVAYNSIDDEYLIVYHNQWASGYEDVYAQRMRASDGQLLSWNAVASSPDFNRYSASASFDPTAGNGLGRYLIVYSRGNSLGTSTFGKAAKTDLAGLFTSPEIDICPACSDNYDPIVFSKAGESLVAWGEGSLSERQVRARRLNNSGVPMGDQNGFDLSSDVPCGSMGPDPDSMAFQQYFGFLVTWTDLCPDPKSWDILGRYVKPGGDSASGSIFPIDNGNEGQFSSRIALPGLEWQHL